MATGASTALLGNVDEEGTLRLLNVGDATLLVLRPQEDNTAAKVVAKSEEIVHYFECPYQLAEDSPDRPKDGTKLTYQLVPGDILVTGSDGIFDNLSEAEICETVMTTGQIAPAGQKERFIVNALCEKSRKVSLDRKAKTPYAKLAKKNGFEGYKDGLGGKIDDISCIVVTCS